LTPTVGTLALVTPCQPDLELIVRELGRSHSLVPENVMRTFASASANVPEVLLVDVRERPQLVQELGSLRRAHPGLGIVIVAKLEPQLMLEAMRAGITECVAEPLERDQLEAAIRRVSSAAPVTRGEVFAFVGAKGGVGTTTLAANVATVIAKAGHSVLFVDLHIAYGDASVYLGVEPRFSVVDALDNMARLDQSVLRSLVASSSAKVDLLASASKDPGRPVDLKGIPALLDLGTRLYRYVVIDVPRNGRAVVDPLEKADSIIVVSNHELAALRSASQLAGALRSRHGSSRVSVVVSRFDRASEITAKDIDKAVGEPVKHTFPSDYRVALQALNQGRPLVLENHTKLAASIHSFARGLARLEAEAEAEPARSSIFGRLTGGKK
jgi:pilus assembly protein CpaE